MMSQSDRKKLLDDVEALRFVQSWAMRHDDPERLVQALLRLARAEKNPEEQRDLLYERGRLLLTRLARPQDAISAFEEAASVDPSFAPALDELAAACESAGDHARLAQTLERQLAHDANPHDPHQAPRRRTNGHRLDASQRGGSSRNAGAGGTQENENIECLKNDEGRAPAP